SRPRHSPHRPVQRLPCIEPLLEYRKETLERLIKVELLPLRPCFLRQLRVIGVIRIMPLDLVQPWLDDRLGRQALAAVTIFLGDIEGSPTPAYIFRNASVIASQDGYSIDQRLSDDTR